MDLRDFCLACILPMLLINFQAKISICQDLTSHPNDLKALIGFSSCLNPPISEWNTSSSDFCTWNGVTCDNSTAKSRRVVGLELGSQRLTGNICESLMGLDQLRILNLSHNRFNSYFPPNFLRFPSLEVLDLSNNYFHGPVLEGSYLLLIRYIDISKNNFNDSLDASLCTNSRHIQVLNLANNYLSGEVSSGFGNCNSLQQLFLNGNSLSGSFPDSLIQLQDLQLLYLQDNAFSGLLHDGIGNLSNLVALDVSNNNFSGGIPDVFGRLQNLQNFSASSNKLSGEIPKSLFNLPSLAILALSNNNLTSATFNCSAMTSLTSINLGGNKFSGPIPEGLSTCRKLSVLSLARNRFVGEIPNNFKNLQALTDISLSNNSLYNLSAALNILQNCKNLTMLFLGMNFRDEHMPSDAFHFENLKVVVITNGQLRGTVPVWLSGCQKLQLLDLSWNHLEGQIPPWLGNFNSLFYIDLSNNSFVGQIPTSLTTLQALWNNSVSSDVSAFDIAVYRKPTVGQGLRYKKLSSFPPTLDLSYNNLTGPIWEAFGNLTRLHILNLKENKLSGSIPNSLSGMKNIESLDLSYNELSGEIPESLVKLSFLSKFSVAFNQLSGTIPTGGQFLTFMYSSFEGNKGLCSAAFGVPCPANSPPPHDDSQEEDISMWGLPFGVGAATGFLLTVAFCFMTGWVFFMDK